MFDVLRVLLTRLEEQSVELGGERARREAAESKLYAPAPQVPSSADVVAMVKFMATGRKIEAIKAYRVLTNYGLKEAKDAIETVTSRFAN